MCADGRAGLCFVGCRRGRRKPGFGGSEQLAAVSLGLEFHAVTASERVAMSNMAGTLRALCGNSARPGAVFRRRVPLGGLAPA